MRPAALALRRPQPRFLRSSAPSWGSVAQTRGTKKKSSGEAQALTLPAPKPGPQLTERWAWGATPPLVTALGHQLLYFDVLPVLLQLRLLVDLVNGLGTLVPPAWHPVALWGQRHLRHHRAKAVSATGGCEGRGRGLASDGKEGTHTRRRSSTSCSIKRIRDEVFFSLMIFSIWLKY